MAQTSRAATLPVKSCALRNAWQTTFAPGRVGKTIPVISLHPKRLNDLNQLPLTGTKFFIQP